MAYFAFFPLAVLAAATLIAGAVCAFVELAERRRARFYADFRTRRRFRPRLIQGGKPAAPAAPPVVAAADTSDKLAG